MCALKQRLGLLQVRFDPHCEQHMHSSSRACPALCTSCSQQQRCLSFAQLFIYQVLVRIGLVSSIQDSPQRMESNDMKLSTSRTTYGCHQCKVLRTQFNHHDFDVLKHARTDLETIALCKRLASITDKKQQLSESVKTGVLVPKLDDTGQAVLTPLRSVHFDSITMMPPDRLHQQFKVSHMHALRCSMTCSARACTS